MSRSIPAGYHVQPSCATCRFRFEYADYDVGDELFCTVDGTARPTIEEYQAWEAWADWSEAHAVSPSGLCPEYKGGV